MQTKETPTRTLNFDRFEKIVRIIFQFYTHLRNTNKKTIRI